MLVANDHSHHQENVLESCQSHAELLLSLELVMALHSLLTLHHNHEDSHAVSSQLQHGAQL